MLVDANLSHWFWPFAASASAHIKVRVPHSSLPKTTTPFEAIMKKKSDLSHIQPFGSLVTSRKTNSNSLNKATECGEEGCFIGYPRDAKGYLIYFLHSRSVLVQRDITFHGFLTSLPTPPPLEFLWDDIPFESKHREWDNEWSPYQNQCNL